MMEKPSSFSVSQNYAPSVAKRLLRFSSQDRAMLEAWLLKFSVGTNYALQILDQLEDLAKKEKKSPAEILRVSLSSLDTQKLQAKELGRRLRDFLEKQLHPHSQAHEEEFARFVKQLHLKPEVTLIPPQNFEGRLFSLKIDFTSLAELKRALEDLQNNLETQDWSPLKSF